MRIIVQRVKQAECVINGSIHSAIKQGFMLLVGLKEGDTAEVVAKAAAKIAKLRIFSDENGKMNLDLAAVDGAILSISQFTLNADLAKGNRPSFVSAMRPDKANELYEYFNDCLRAYGITVKCGIFGADMQIKLINDGPVTIVVDY